MQDHHASEHIPIIFITAMSNNDARLKGFELGAIDFVAKPINPEVLKPRVRNFMHYVELNKQLQAEYDAMQELAELREDLKNIIRYDMKQPLAELIGLIQDLVDEASLNAKQINKLRTVEENSLQTLNMVNLSSELYKIETGIFQLDAQPVNIDSILRRIVEIFRNTYAAKQLNLAISAEEPPKNLGDAMLCYSLLNNLLKNACGEAAPEKSSVLVAVVNEDPIQIMIRNKGVVQQSMRDGFFDKFVAQQKPTDARLGFYSAKLFTEAQNGKIALKVSEEKNLTTISVSLPRFKAEFEH
ncbi:MAG TPA: HAMP domain-containing sensor histidine kinase [Methylobacter sp.]|jgi:hypothetical protein